MALTEVQHTSWQQLWLPLWPYASDELYRGIYREGRQQALGRRYVEANPQALSNLLVIDIDHPDALLRAIEDRHGWLPNAVVQNRLNGHAHAVWAMREAITRTEYARLKPLVYATAITEGLRRSVDGDKGYSGLMTKNPTHNHWDATWFTDHLYSLPELHEHLDSNGFMPPRSWNRTRRKHPVGLGRNCAIFETARKWAYPEVRRHFGDSPGLHHAIAGHVHALNAGIHNFEEGFTEPLPTNEAQAIANSIHRWITTRSRMWADGPVVYEATLSTIQSHRGRKSGKSRQVAWQEREAAILGGQD